MEHTPKEEEKRLREEFINKIELDKMIKDIGYTGAKGTIADYWLKIRREAIAEEKEALKKWAVEFGATGAMIDQRDRRWIDLEDFIYHLTQE